MGHTDAKEAVGPKGGDQMESVIEQRIQQLEARVARIEKLVEFLSPEKVREMMDKAVGVCTKSISDRQTNLERVMAGYTAAFAKEIIKLGGSPEGPVFEDPLKSLFPDKGEPS